MNGLHEVQGTHGGPCEARRDTNDVVDWPYLLSPRNHLCVRELQSARVHLFFHAFNEPLV